MLEPAAVVPLRDALVRQPPNSRDPFEIRLAFSNDFIFHSNRRMPSLLAHSPLILDGEAKGGLNQNCPWTGSLGRNYFLSVRGGKGTARPPGAAADSDNNNQFI